ncbi:hypothetical protein EI42_00103 [Thermosporothrix hazakensis]|jgi:hypothetical protein|uniref:Uncharacterized protein n=2 Tax=Thermosporothrix TaxID=768650 RepID=A0A326UBR8_THEHA|nr:zinc ribbon domain-containing protein [Thermosporothrix hazakensis]PZW35937.1 hypothetical protein EI42_00103 [Thermosporothrix hazakensis]BBH88405.1 hypothetical protein KTC_31560 [Thermosporothrix sp. COM3]GCE46592.1 hypothetical protein KTH_14610 [Thermosporothrix hazakensis]
MIYCGQCGLQLAPGETRCPRCGAAVDAGAATSTYASNEETIQAQSFIAQHPPYQQQATPQKLILGNQTYADAGDATRMMDEVNPGNYPPPGYSQQPGYSGGNYSSMPLGQQGGYVQPRNTPPFPSQAYQGYPSGGQYPQHTSYPAHQMQQPQVEGGQQNANARGRTAALATIFVGILFILAAMLLFFLQHNGIIS